MMKLLFDDLSHSQITRCHMHRHSNAKECAKTAGFTLSVNNIVDLAMSHMWRHNYGFTTPKQAPVLNLGGSPAMFQERQGPAAQTATWTLTFLHQQQNAQERV